MVAYFTEAKVAGDLIGGGKACLNVASFMLDLEDDPFSKFEGGVVDR